MVNWRALAIVLVVLAVGAWVWLAFDDDCADQALLAIDGNGAEVAYRGDELRVAVTSVEGFRVAALVWVLRIGEFEFDEYDRPSGRNDRLEFRIPDEAVPRLKDGAGIGIRYGNPIGLGSDRFGPVFAGEPRSEDFATLRITGGCE
jgi:hypothetical protein